MAAGRYAARVAPAADCDMISAGGECMSQLVTYARPDGKECSGFYTEPAAGITAAGVVVIQEWWGLNEQIKRVADRLAAAGYRALVPDLYRGRVTVEAKEAEHLMGDLNFADVATQDIRGAVQYLKNASEKVGVTGFCMGGALTILTAVNVEEVDVSVSWYGFPPLEYVDAGRIRAPLMGHYARNDAFFPIQQVDLLEEKLRSAGVIYEFYRYDAQHAFANETAVGLPIPAAYNPEAAETAWQRTMGFLASHLQSGASTRSAGR
jgi:carboxymethylenebutenolidase